MILPLLALGALGALALNTAAKAAWEPLIVASENDGPLAQGAAVSLMLRNTTNGQVVVVAAQVAGQNADGTYTLLLWPQGNTGPSPYGFEPGKFATLTRAYLKP